MNATTESDDPVYWKNKYLRLLDQDDERRLELEQKEELLTQAVVRLCLAADGLDPSLNPHLRAIREAVRGEKHISMLREKLNALLDSMVRAPEVASMVEFTPIGLAVLRFIGSLSLDSGSRNRLEFLQRRVEAGDYRSDADLFAAAKALLETEQQEQDAGSSGLLRRLFGRGARAAGSMPDENVLRQHLADLMRALKLPLALDNQRSKLVAATIEEGEGIVDLIDRTAVLIAALGVESEREHTQLRDFLAALSGKLVDLEEKTLGVGSLAETTARSRIEADLAVSGHVENMRAVALAATDFSQLQTLVASRLDIISAHLAESKAAEEIRIAETQREVQELAARLQSLEQESLELRTQLSMASNLALTDALTHLPNRAAYEDRVVLEEFRWKRFKHPLALLLWDIDFFKSINDRFGHPAGDKALKVIAEVMGGSIRATDFLARVGGEEFAMLLAGTDEMAALDVADSIRRKVEQCGFTSGGNPVAITVSCGISAFRDNEGHDQVYHRADQALYEAKRSGRNRCVVKA